MIAPRILSFSPFGVRTRAISRLASTRAISRSSKCSSAIQFSCSRSFSSPSQVLCPSSLSSPSAHSSSSMSEIPSGSISRVLIVKKVSLLAEVRRQRASANPSQNSPDPVNSPTRDSRLYSRDSASALLVDPKVLAADREHQNTLEIVRQSLDRHGLEVKEVEAINADDLSWCDLVVSVGGDGNFLRICSQLSESYTKPILAVNSAPSSSFGFFSSADYYSFPGLLKRVLGGRAKFIGLWRLRVRLNGRLIGPPVLNEILLSSPVPSLTTRYIVNTSNGNESISQSQQSSGVWLSTASGSTGAIQSAGGYVQALNDPRGQFRIRELFTLPILYPRALERDQMCEFPHFSQNANWKGEPAQVNRILNNRMAQNPVSLPPPASPHSLFTSNSSTGRLIEGGFIGKEFSIVCRMMNGSLYFDGSANSISIGFNEKLTFRRSLRPINWISPTCQISSNEENLIADNWELVTGQLRPDYNRIVSNSEDEEIKAEMILEEEKQAEFEELQKTLMNAKSNN